MTIQFGSVAYSVPTASSSTRTKLSCCGSDRDTVFPSKTVVFQFYNSVPTP